MSGTQPPEGQPIGRQVSPPIGSLFIANRGEIARRIARTAEDLGIAVVVAELDGAGAVDLLSPGSVVAAAVAARADAVHPGYGFLAESPALAEAVLAAGLAWVGPPPAAIRSLGDKAEAREIARSTGVPVADGEEPEDQSDASLGAAAARIGYPVLVKPAAGGGGKGIRIAREPGLLGGELEAARREATRAFGDGRLLLERYIEDARHVEVQVLADAHGAVVHLGERDCSLQRRHQKLLEEAPAPGLDGAVRRALWDHAVRLARAVRYVGAGTCEFLVADDGSVAFLEVNARLQVEHPVTELVLGRDLVADQLAIAGGARLADLGLDQAAVERRLEAGGHAIEVRLNAEDPGSGFLPSTGRVVEVRWPTDAASFGPAGASGIRVDAGIAAGDEVSGRFDPLLAKVIAHGPDRASALARLARALGETELLGLPTNLAFMRRLVRLPVVAQGLARVTTVEHDPAAGATAQEPAIPDAAWRAAAGALLDSGAAGGAGGDGAWSGGWRANGPRAARLEADPSGAGLRRVVALDLDAAGGGSAPAPGAVLALEGGLVHVSVEGRSMPFRLEPPPDIEAAVRHAGPVEAEVRSPMTGVVVAVHAAAGTEVEPGARIATLEAMKMEHAVTAPGGGRLEAVLVRVGDRVQRGEVVARIGGAA